MDRKLLKKLWAYLAPFKGYLALALLFLFLTKLLETYIPFYAGYLVQKMLGTSNTNGATMHAVTYGVLWMLFLIVIGCIMEMGTVYLKGRIGQRAIFGLRQDVYRHILTLPEKVLDRSAVGKLMTRTIHDIDQIDQMFTDSLVPLIGGIFLFFTIGGAVFYLNWRIALLGIALLPFLGVFLFFFRKVQRRCYQAIRTIVASMNGFLQEHLSGVMVIRSFGLEKGEKKRFEELNTAYCDAYFESSKNFGILISGIEFLSNLALISTFALFAIYGVGESFQAGAFFTLILYTVLFFRPLIDLAERYNVLQSALAAAERVFEVLDQPLENRGPVPGLSLSGIQTIQFQEVWFAYEKENWVLKGLNFSLKSGEILAVVGVTGAGKSTLMNILLRLYDFQKGSILINGQDIRSFNAETLRYHFSVIFQDPILFSGPLAENIAFYDPAIQLSEIQTVTQEVGLRLPQNILLSERGKTLSMGERQLIALARAVAHKRSILIFDEATANIDTETEQLIQKALAKILPQQTSLIIAHRLSTIKSATRILVLHEGIAKESGTHTELLAHNGLYARLYRLQFS